MTDPEARIDEALRRIVGVHAPDDFVSQVQRRIAGRRPAPVTWRPLAAAAVGLLVVAAGIATTWRAPAPAPAPPRVAVAQAPAGPGSAVRAAPRPAVEVRDARPRSATSGARRPAAAAAPDTAPRDHERALPPLPGIETLEVAPLSVAPLTLADHAPVPLPAILPLDMSGGPDDVGGDR